MAKPTAAPSATSIEALAATAANPDAATFDPQSVRPVLADPRLAEVKALMRKEAHKGAADKLAALLREVAPKSAEEPLWSYQLGRLRLQAGDPMAAIRAFDRAAAADWVLADYARFMSADLLVQVGQPAQALARLAQIEEGTALGEQVQLVAARAHVAARDVDSAAPIWRRYLAKRPRPKDWQLEALRFARALRNQPTVDHAEEMVKVARQVIHASVGGRGVGEARKLEEQALLTIPSKRRARLVKPQAAELMARARDLADARQGREALAASAKVIKLLTRADGGEDDTPSEVSCEAYLARGKGLAVLRRYSESSDAYATAIKRCEGRERQVYALFVGARSALRGGKIAAARKRYAQLEKSFPKHRFADDARLHGAEAARDLGDVAAFTRMLLTIADAYPEGDMVDDALFTLARARIADGDWAGVVVPLERAIKKQPRGRPYYAEGRPQYFLARAKIELGSTEEGLALLAGVIRDFPLSYYMVHAYSRLAAHDPERAARAWRDARNAEPRGDFVIPDHPELHRPAFLRAIELVRQGDGERAVAELDTLGVRDKSAHPSLLWAGAFLLARIDAPAESHQLLRTSTQIWKEHHPAGVWRGVWEVAYPRPFLGIVEKEIKRSPIPEHLAFAIIREESAFKPRAVSHAGAYGLMQLIVPTADQMARPLNLPSTKEALKQPAVNIALGCRFLSILLRKFKYNPLLAIPGYNAGPGRPKKWVARRPADDFDLWVERIPFRETRRYTKRVIGSMAAYAALYGDGMKADLMRLPLEVKPGDPADAQQP